MAFRLNHSLREELKTAEKAKTNDFWKTIGFGFIATSSLLISKYAPHLSPYSTPSAIGAGISAAGSCLNLINDDNTITKIKSYETNLHAYV